MLIAKENGNRQEMREVRKREPPGNGNRQEKRTARPRTCIQHVENDRTPESSGNVNHQSGENANRKGKMRAIFSISKNVRTEPPTRLVTT